MMLTAAVLVPTAFGLNATPMLQLLFTAKELPHLLLRTKSLLLVPASAMLLMVSVAVPPLVSVTVWYGPVVPTFWLPNNKDALETVRAGAVPAPVIETVWTDCATPPLLSVIASAALLVPAAVGLNCTVMLQLLAAFRVPPQLVLFVKSPAFAPVSAMLLMVSVALPVFESFTVC